jgi:hypothetical protein
MSDSAIHLFSIADVTKESLSSIESCQKVGFLKSHLLKSTKKIAWPVLFHEILDNLDLLLRLNYLDIIVRAWKKYGIFLRYVEPIHTSSDKIQKIFLAEHKIKSEHHPYIEIVINNKRISKIDVEISLVLMIKGIALEIQNRKLKKITAGTIRGSGTVKCENILILEKKTEELQLPGTLDLGDGISIL